MPIDVSTAATVALFPRIPQPARRQAIVQLFNWTFKDIAAAIPRLGALGYSHVHVSPPQKSNEAIWQWWGRYQPADYDKVEGPLGAEAEFRAMAAAARQHGVRIIVDVVPMRIAEPSDAFAGAGGDARVLFNLPGRGAGHEAVREAARAYLRKLAGLGAHGYRFDGAANIAPDFYPAVLAAVPNMEAFGEIVAERPHDFVAHLATTAMRYYDFPLLATMREAFAPGGDLRLLKEPQARGRALDGLRALTFVRNHDIERGQAFDRGIDDAHHRGLYGVGWDEARRTLERADVRLAYAYLFGREDGAPYVFAAIKAPGRAPPAERYDDPFLVAAVRFHNLCLAGPDGAGRRPEVWRIETQTAIGWQRGDDRFAVINKAAEAYRIRGLPTSLKPGMYREVRTAWSLRVANGGMIAAWDVPPREAVLFVRTTD